MYLYDFQRMMEKNNQALKPYTIQEIRARIAQSELDSVEGRVYDFDDVIREIEEDLFGTRHI